MSIGWTIVVMILVAAISYRGGYKDGFGDGKREGKKEGFGGGNDD